MSETLTLFGPPAPSRQVVYVATDLHDLKVGTTTNRKRRGGELHLIYLATFPGDELVERRLHRRWKSCRLGDSEWFRPDDALLAEILRWIRPGDTKALAALHQLARNNQLKDTA